jgi:hypothetical protein
MTTLAAAAAAATAESATTTTTATNATRIGSRRRAESFDERKSSFSSTFHNMNRHLPNDPTIELELTNPSSTIHTTALGVGSTSTNFMTSSLSHGNGHGSNHTSSSSGTTSSSSNSSTETLPFRKRSVSCSVVFNSSSPRRCCETIMEE